MAELICDGWKEDCKEEKVGKEEKQFRDHRWVVCMGISFLSLTIAFINFN